MSQDLDPIQRRVEKMSTSVVSVNGRLKALGQARRISWSKSWDPAAFRYGNLRMITAVLAHGRGDVAAQSCRNCRENEVPFRQCMIIPGFLNAACSNCHFKKPSHECSFMSTGLTKKDTVKDASAKGEASKGEASKGKTAQCKPAAIPTTAPSRTQSKPDATPPVRTPNKFAATPRVRTPSAGEPADPHYQLIVARRRIRQLQQELEMIKSDMDERNEQFKEKMEARNALVVILIKSAGQIEDSISKGTLELHKGFRGLTGDLPQIHARIEELESFVNETSSVAMTSINEAREACKQHVDVDELPEFERLYDEGSAGNNEGRKLSFTNSPGA